MIVGRDRAVRKLPAAVVGLLTALVAAGCGSEQSTLAPKSKPAREISTLFWDMMIGAWLGLALIVALLVLAWMRRKHRGGDRLGRWLVGGAGIALPILVVATLFVASDIFLIRDSQAPAAGATTMTITVVAHQWFWEARYPGSKAVVADEIHIPSQTSIDLEVRTVDVIHSFWVPALNRKIDVIPGRTNRILLRADQPGTFRGQCAEFCGLQHANMAFLVVAQPPAQFRAWLARQAQPAHAPVTEAERMGQRVFLDGACSSCHTIRGTSASGGLGPDLTHLATRTTLGGLVIANRRDDLREWIVDSQHLKPGNLMPNIDLATAQLNDLLAYLESLR